MKHSERFVQLVEEAKSRVREVTPEETRAKLEGDEGVIVVDVREDNEWEAGHVRGAVHIGKGVIERDIEKYAPDTDTEIILYCGGGYRSILAADNLQNMGYTNVASMAEGWRGWKDREYETKK